MKPSTSRMWQKGGKGNPRRQVSPKKVAVWLGSPLTEGKGRGLGKVSRCGKMMNGPPEGPNCS